MQYGRMRKIPVKECSDSEIETKTMQTPTASCYRFSLRILTLPVNTHFHCFLLLWFDSHSPVSPGKRSVIMQFNLYLVGNVLINWLVKC